jgi:hypothetical protein
MNEYEMKLKSVAGEFISARSSNGSMSFTILFGLLSVLVGKNKITEKDLDVIFEVEERILLKNIADHFSSNFGSPGSMIENDQELKAVTELCKEQIKFYKTQIINASNSLRESKRKRGKKDDGQGQDSKRND